MLFRRRQQSHFRFPAGCEPVALGRKLFKSESTGTRSRKMGENLLQTAGASGKHPHACRITRTLNEVITTLGGQLVSDLQRTWEPAVNRPARVPPSAVNLQFGQRSARTAMMDP
jgi:hypothetical protein